MLKTASKNYVIRDNPSIASGDCLHGSRVEWDVKNLILVLHLMRLTRLSIESISKIKRTLWKFEAVLRIMNTCVIIAYQHGQYCIVHKPNVRIACKTGKTIRTLESRTVILHHQFLINKHLKNMDRGILFISIYKGTHYFTVHTGTDAHAHAHPLYTQILNASPFVSNHKMYKGIKLYHHIASITTSYLAAALLCSS